MLEKVLESVQSTPLNINTTMKKYTLQHSTSDNHRVISADREKKSAGASRIL